MKKSKQKLDVVKGEKDIGKGKNVIGKGKNVIGKGKNVIGKGKNVIEIKVCVDSMDELKKFIKKMEQEYGGTHTLVYEEKRI